MQLGNHCSELEAATDYKPFDVGQTSLNDHKRVGRSLAIFCFLTRTSRNQEGNVYIFGQKEILGCTGKFGRSADSRPPKCSCFGRFK